MCDPGKTCAIDPITNGLDTAGHAVTGAASDAASAVGHAAGGVASDAVSAVAGDWLQSQLTTFMTWVGKAVIWATSWWADQTTMDPNTPTVIALQHQIVPIALIILTIGVLWQAGKIVVSRKPAPLVDVAAGLVRYYAVAVAGLAFWEAVIQLTDAGTGWVLGSTTQDFGTALGQRLMLLVAPTVTGGPEMPMLALLVIGLVLMVASIIQWILAWIRLAGIQILAVLLPLAAAGSITESTRPWLRKVNAWMAALVTYKLIAAIIYRIGFAFLTTPLTGVSADMEPISRTMIGLLVLLLAIFVLPAMMKFFAWAGADASGGGVLGAVMGAGAVAVGAVKGAEALRGLGASNSAAQIATNGPGSGGNPAPPGGPAALPPGPGGPPSSPAPAGASPTTSPGSQTGGPGTAPSGGNQPAPAAAGSGTQPGQGQSSPAPGATPTPGTTSTPGGTPAPGASPAPGAAPTAPGATPAAASAGTAGAGAGAAGAGAEGVALAAGAAAVRHVTSQAHGVGGQPPQTS